MSDHKKYRAEYTITTTSESGTKTTRRLKAVLNCESVDEARQRIGEIENEKRKVAILSIEEMPGELSVDHVRVDGWDVALNAARVTENKPYKDKEPTELFKRRLLFAEHSPIRCVTYSFIIRNLPMWVTTHLVRHHVGVEKFVGTQRVDRTGSKTPRGEHKQGEHTSMMMHLNAQALIGISRERLCGKASKETREAWQAVIGAVQRVDPIVTDYCVRKCVRYGRCTEPDGCGYADTETFKRELENYVQRAKKQRNEQF